MFIDITVVSAPSSPSNLSTVTLVGSCTSETSPQDFDVSQTETETETEIETETDLEANQQQDICTELKEPEVMSPVAKENSEELTKPSGMSVQFRNEEKRASVPILESERRPSRTQVKRKGSDGPARRDGCEEEKGKADDFQLSDESCIEGPSQPAAQEHKAGTSSRSASITTTSVIQVTATQI
jgi:hypothetical protein